MCGCRRENGFGAFGGLELPAGFQQYFRAVGLIGAQNSLSFDAGGQGTDQQGHDKHNATGNRYPGSLIRVKYGCVKKQLKMRTESREEIKL